MKEALQRSQDSSNAPDLKVSVLLDYTRGSRGCQHFPRHPFVADLLGARCSTPWMLFLCFYMQDRLTQGPCFCRCCSTSPLRCEFLCTTLQTWGGFCGCWSLNASTRPSESNTSKSICLTTALLSVGMLMPQYKSSPLSVWSTICSQNVFFVKVLKSHWDMLQRKWRTACFKPNGQRAGLCQPSVVSTPLQFNPQNSTWWSHWPEATTCSKSKQNVMCTKQYVLTLHTGLNFSSSFSGWLLRCNTFFVCFECLTYGGKK